MGLVGFEGELGDIWAETWVKWGRGLVNYHSCTKCTNTYYLWVSVCLGPRCGWAGPSVWLSVSHETAVKVTSGTAVLAKPDRTGKDPLQSYSRGCWQDLIPPNLLDGGCQLLTGCWSSDHPLFFVTSVSAESSSQMATRFIKASEKSHRERVSKKDVRVLHNLISGWHPIAFALLYSRSILVCSLEASH